MRFVPINCLRPGQMLASDLIADKNRTLLRNGVELTPQMILRLRELGCQGAFIDDEISRDLQVVSIISDQMKSTVTSKLRRFYHYAEHNVDKDLGKGMESLRTTIVEMVDEILSQKEMLVSILDLQSYDNYTYGHSLNVAILCVVIGTALGLCKADLQNLAIGAIVHDIGKIFIDKSIINKPGRLTQDEYSEVKQHSLLGFRYISDKIDSKQAEQLVLSHHEHYDGTGYPYGLSGNDIPLFGRIACIADVYDALTSDRPYRRALSPSDAFEYIMSQNNVLFEPKIVQAFTRRMMPYPVGTCVRLSTGDIGIVINNFESCSLRPVVRLIYDHRPSDECIDLAHNPAYLNITVEGVVSM